MLNRFYDKFIFTSNLKFKHDNFFLDNLPFIIAPSELFVGILAQDSAEFNRQLYYSVKNAMIKKVIPRFGLEFGFGKEKELQFLQDYFMASGWGKIIVNNFDVDNHRAIVVLENNPFTSYFKSKSKKPVDHLFRGILAGIFSIVFGNDIECVETECSALGANACKFVLKKQVDFNLESKEVREQLELDV